MGFFNRQKTNYVGEMREYIKSFMLKYIKEYPLASDVVIPIFSNAEQMVGSLSEKEISKIIKTHNVNIECGALNIIQNLAMTELELKSGVDFLKGDNYTYDLYNYINEYKYDRGYISESQFEENKMLATKLSLQPPFMF